MIFIFEILIFLIQYNPMLRYVVIYFLSDFIDVLSKVICCWQQWDTMRIDLQQHLKHVLLKEKVV